MNGNHSVLRILLTGLLLGIAACSPVKETRYNYLPPQDAQGQACVAQCSTTYSSCLREADKVAAGERDRCELEARQDYDICLSRPAGDNQPLCEPRRCTVSAEAAACDGPYRACFQTCGGFVETQQVCILNCE